MLCSHTGVERIRIKIELNLFCLQASRNVKFTVGMSEKTFADAVEYALPKLHRRRENELQLQVFPSDENEFCSSKCASEATPCIASSSTDNIPKTYHIQDVNNCETIEHKMYEV